MKIGDLIVALIVGIAVGSSLHSCMGVDDKENVEKPICNRTEEYKLKIALQECSDAIMDCTWEEVH